MTRKHPEKPTGQAVFENVASALIAAALGDKARTIGMTHVVSKAEVTREALYKALSPTGDPRLSTFLGAMKAFGIKLTPRAAGADLPRHSHRRPAQP